MPGKNKLFFFERRLNRVVSAKLAATQFKSHLLASLSKHHKEVGGFEYHLTGYHFWFSAARRKISRRAFRTERVRDFW
jgi:hypothetical protein